MLVKPNEKTAKLFSDNDYPNDLYRKFREIFNKILHPDDISYNPKIYIKTNNKIEESVIGYINDMSDGIIPILGYTGMGKTSLMHYCIKTNFGYENILKNRNFILTKDGQNALFIYASYDANCERENHESRLAGKFSAASNLVLERLKISNKTKEEKRKISAEVAAYIKDNKPELLEACAPSTYALDIEKAECLYQQKRLAYEAEKLKWALTNYHTDIQSIVLVLDDIEGILDDEEYTVIDTYLTMYDCLRRYKSDKNTYNVKLFICMRESSYNAIKNKPWYDTHRTASALSLHSGIQLGEIFEKRFNYIVEKEKILEDVEKKENWAEAKDILMELCNYLNKISSGDILQICNYNVSNALQLFMSILSNRQWTQKNERMQDSFRIERYHFYLSPASSLKAIAMRNSTIYTNGYEIPNIFFKNNNNGFCLPILLLLMLQKTPSEYRELTLAAIQENIIDVLKLEGAAKMRKERQIQEIIKYFFDTDIVFKKVIKYNSEVITMYYIAPKGQILLQHLFENTILLEMYRDDIYIDDNRHDTRCSYSMNRDDLFKDIIKLIEDIAEEEIEFWESSVNNNTQEIYYILWGDEKISIKLISAMKRSLYSYYKQEIPDELKKIIMAVEQKYGDIFKK